MRRLHTLAILGLALLVVLLNSPTVESLDRGCHDCSDCHDASEAEEEGHVDDGCAVCPSCCGHLVSYPQPSALADHRILKSSGLLLPPYANPTSDGQRLNIFRPPRAST